MNIKMSKDIFFCCKYIRFIVLYLTKGDYMSERMDNASRKIFRERLATKFRDIDLAAGKRITLDKKYLDCLLFDYDKMGKKVFAYFDKGLSKVDLSTVDLSDVTFPENKQVDLSNTNVKIDFSEFCPSSKLGITTRHIIRNIDFSGVNLSHSLDSCSTIHTFEFFDCNLSNTKLKLKRRQVYFKGCNLSGVDLSFTTLKCEGLTTDGHVSMMDFLPGTFESGTYNVWVNNCNLSNTKANILIDKNEVTTQKDYGTHGALHKTIKVDICEYLSEQMAEGKLDGVNFIGATIKPAEKKEPSEATKTKRELVQKQLSAAINGALDLIDEQLNGSIGGKMAKDAVLPVADKKETPKKEETNKSSYYPNRDNTFIIPTPRELTPEEKAAAARKAANVKKYGKRLKPSPEVEAYLAGFDNWFQGDWIDE